jgi:DNA-binding MarR family transcriptional regulator
VPKAHSGSRGNARTPWPTNVEVPLIRVGNDFEDEYPDASALATECYANLWRAAELLMELHNRPSLDEYQLSPGARQVLAVVDGAREPLEPNVIASRLLVTTASMTSLLDNLEKRHLIVRQPHPDDRRKLLISITPAAQSIVDALLPAMHARERDVMDDALSAQEQHMLLKLMAKIQRAAIGARSASPSQGAVRRRAVSDPSRT